MAISQPIVPPKKPSGGLFGEIGDAIGGLAQLTGTAASFVPIPAVQAAGKGLGAAGGAVSTINALTADKGGGAQAPVSPLQSMAESPAMKVAQLNDFETAINKDPLIQRDERLKLLEHSAMAKREFLSRMGRA